MVYKFWWWWGIVAVTRLSLETGKLVTIKLFNSKVYIFTGLEIWHTGQKDKKDNDGDDETSYIYSPTFDWYALPSTGLRREIRFTHFTLKCSRRRMGMKPRNFYKE